MVRASTWVGMAVAAALSAGAAYAQDAPAARDAEAAPSLAQQLLAPGVTEHYTKADEAGGAPAWHEIFTLTREGDVSYLADRSFSFDNSLFAADDDRSWGFTLDVRDVHGVLGEGETAEEVSAGAFVSVGPRLRLGGELRMRDLERDPLSWEGVQDTPQIKLQSAFRF